MTKTQQCSRAHPAALAAAFLAGLVVALAIGARAQPQLELGVGFCHSQRAPDGIWHESQFPEHNETSAACGQIAARLPIARGWGARLAYTDFGKTSSDSIAVNDESVANHVVMGSAHCSLESNGACLGHWQGGGGRYGWSAGVYRDFALGAWHLQPEVGLIAYSYWWHEVVTQYEAGGPTLTLDESGRGHAPYFAASLARGPFFARVEYFNRLKGGIAQGSAVNLFLGGLLKF